MPALCGCRSSEARENAALAPPALVVAVEEEPKEGFDPLLGWGRYGAPLFQSTLAVADMLSPVGVHVTVASQLPDSPC